MSIDQLPFKRITNPVNEFIQALRIEGSFSQNLAISFSGNAMAQVLGFAFTPFIARIYGPEAYGVFALYMAIVSNLSPLSTLQLPAAYVATETDEEFYGLIRVTLIALFGSLICISTMLFFWGNDFVEIFQLQEIRGYLFFIPVYLFFMGINSIFLGWSIRLKEFKLGAWAKMLSILSSKTTTLLWGMLLAPSAAGIIVGNLLIYPIDNFVKAFGAIKSDFKKVFSAVSTQYILSLLKKFKGYPVYIMPGLMVSNLSALLPIYCFSIYFLPADVGFFAMAGTLVSTPLNIIITSSTSVFLQKAAETKQTNPDKLGAMSLSLYKRLFFVGVIPLSILAFISIWVFRFLLGSEWEMAGIFASFLAVSAIFSVPAQPLSVLFRLVHFERTNLLLNLGFVVLKFGALLIGVYYSNLMVAIIVYSFVTILSHVASLFFIFKILNQSRKILWLHTAIVILLFAVVVLLRGY